MRTRIDGILVSVFAASALAGCVDGFRGSNVQIDFAPTVGPQGAPDPTYFTLYAVDQVADESGVVTAEYLFAVHDFRIQPAIDLASPCAIELEAPYPGLHISAFPAKEREQTGVTDPTLPGQDERAVERVLTADQRLAAATMMQSIKAVTSAGFATYPAVATACVEDQAGVDPALIPPANCIGATSNARRLALCQAAWAAAPTRYEGTDRSLTAPLAGEAYGFVQGQNPLTGAPLGGSQMFVDEVLIADAYAINWQYADLDGNGTPDYPASVPAEDRSPTGFGYLSGFPRQVARGVTQVPLVSTTDRTVNANMAIVADLGDDPVQF